jgi:hypothetical protein
MPLWADKPYCRPIDGALIGNAPPHWDLKVEKRTAEGEKVEAIFQIASSSAAARE